MTNYLKTAAAVGALAFAVTESSAAFINGDILLLGPPGGAATVSQTATTTTFNPNNPWIVGPGTGDYTGLSGIATMAPITFNTLSGALVSGGSPTWIFTSGGNTYDFTLVNLLGASYTQTPVVGGGFTSAISMTGNGIATSTAPGFVPTAASWSLNGSGPNLILSIATETTSAAGTQPPTTTPDGGTTAALLGIGFVGAAIARKKLS